MGSVWKEYVKAYEELDDNWYSRKRVDKIIRKHGNTTRASRVRIRNGHSKWLCDNTRSPEKMSPFFSVLFGCNGTKGRAYQVSSAARGTLKKYHKRKMRQWLKTHMDQ